MSTGELPGHSTARKAPRLSPGLTCVGGTNATQGKSIRSSGIGQSIHPILTLAEGGSNRSPEQFWGRLLFQVEKPTPFGERWTHAACLVLARKGRLDQVGELQGRGGAGS